MMELGLECRAVLVFVGFIVAASVLGTHLKLLKIERDSPETLRNAGILKIDWWFRCMFGVFLLAFRDVGAALPRETRIVLQTSVVSTSAFLLGIVSCTML
jgi:hypothetical protein